MRILFPSLLVLMLGASAASAQTDVTDVVIKEAERVLIEEYFGKKKAEEAKEKKAEEAKEKKAKEAKEKARRGPPGGMPPGLAKRGELPPGLAKRDQLPPGLAKRGLPADLEGALPPPPDGTERVVVDSDVVLIEKATGTILDILKDVVTVPAP